MTALEKGEAKKALAHATGDVQEKQFSFSGHQFPIFFNLFLIRSFRNIFSLSHTGMALANEATPFGQKHNRFQAAVQLQEWFVIKNNGIKFFKSNACVIETKPNGICRKARIMFMAGKSFFLCSSNNGTTLNQCRRRIVIERRYS
jgi:hypothetical protein